MIHKSPWRLSLLLCLLLCCLLASCDLPPQLGGTATPTTNSPDNNGTGNNDGSGNPPMNTWIQAQPGVELRYEDWKGPSGNEDTITITRFDPRHITLRVAYQPDKPLTISQWMKQEQATAILNGGYFDDQNNATGLVISDGQASGASYSGFGGMLSVDSSGHIHLRSLRQTPYDSGENLRQATQSEPMLILPGGQRAQFDANAASSRRTVVAFDRQGRLLFIVSPGMAFSLDEFADLLVASDLSLNVALNLDGGSSTGLYVNAGSQHVAVDSFNAVPIAVIVQAK